MKPLKLNRMFEFHEKEFSCQVLIELSDIASP